MRAGRWRWAVIGCCVCTICFLSVYMIHKERTTCMGVPILTEKQRSQFTQYEYTDYSFNLFFHGEKAAVDVQSSTIYIPQSLEASTRAWELQGQLRTDRRNRKLYFVESPSFENLNEMMRQGHSLKLLISDGSEKYMEYDVVLTSLPVIRMEGQVTSATEEGRDLWSGSFCAWTPEDPEVNTYTVKTSDVQWHVRGQSSSWVDKAPWKLSTKDRTGRNKNMSLLGLGADDDWILNSMPFDDTKMREKFMIDWWNEAAEAVGSKMKMAAGQYAEVVVNGEYMGVFLLQRRIDRKYLDLNPNAVLMKGNPTWVADLPNEAYKIVYSSLTPDTTFARFVDNFFYGNSWGMVDVDNFAYVNLALLFGSATDNTGYKNMFYVFVPTDDHYTISYIPWDTDMSFGVIYNAGFIYDYEISMNRLTCRQEYEDVLAVHPQLNQRMCDIWSSLRKDILSDTSIHASLNNLAEQLSAGGAYARDIAKWGTHYGQEDTQEKLRSYILERASKLDQYFAEQQ